MDKQKIAAFDRLFNKKSRDRPTQADVDLLRDALYLDETDSDTLRNQNPSAMEGLTTFLDDQITYIEYEVSSKDHQNFLRDMAGMKKKTGAEKPIVAPVEGFVPSSDLVLPGEKGHKKTKPPPQQLAGLPIDTLPEKKPPVAAKKKVAQDTTKSSKPAPAPPPINPPTPPPPLPKPVASPAKAEPARVTALRHLFDPASVTFSDADVHTIGTRWREERNDSDFLSAEVLGQIAACEGLVDGNDSVAYIESIDDGTRPQLNEMQRETLRQLLRMLLKVVENFDVSPFARGVHHDPLWHTLRKIVEQAFADSRSSDSARKADGEARVQAWWRHVVEYSRGYAGPRFIPLGDHLFTCMQILEQGANPTSAAYRAHYVNT